MVGGVRGAISTLTMPTLVLGDIWSSHQKHCSSLVSGSHVLKEELKLFLMSLTKGGEFNEADGTDEQLLNAIDTGGLWHVRENTLAYFVL